MEQIKNHLKSVPTELLKPIEKQYLTDAATTELLLELEWKRFFTSYSMAFNKQQNRTGNLFHRPFKRIEIDKESYFTQAIVYIHANAQHHNLSKDFTQHKWTSWHSMLSNNPTGLKREEVLEWFGGLEKFIEIHKSMTEYYYNSNVVIEE